MDNDLLSSVGEDLEFGFFGDKVQQTHLLVGNRRTWEPRSAVLEVKGEQVSDAVTGEVLVVEDGAVAVELAAGGFRLLVVGSDVDRGS